MKRHAPAAERNRGPIVEILRQVLPPRGTVLEIASGSGQHAVFFAAELAHLSWQPSDIDEQALGSIRAWIADSGVNNVLPPLRLDAAAEPWPVSQADALISINMIHIAPWRACQGLMAGAGRLLAPGGVLFMYGPFFIEGRNAAPSNVEFDASLRERDPAWGVRGLHEVAAEAARHGMELDRVHDMPANNISAVFRKR